MSARDLGFYAFAAMLLGFGIAAVTLRDLFRTVLAFLGVLLCTAVLFLLLEAETVALVQVMVYIGGVMIFLLYGVLLTSELGGRMEQGSFTQRLGALAGCLAIGGLLVAAIWTTAFPVASADFGPIADLKSIGMRLLDDGADGFLIPFELISVILVAASVGAIALAKSEPEPKHGNSKVTGNAKVSL